MSVNTKLTNLANEIREISGTTTKKSLDVMTSDISAANNEISTQGDLIAQLQAAVDSLPEAGGHVKPSGTLDITENGEYVVAEYEKVNVNIPGLTETEIQTKLEADY